MKLTLLRCKVYLFLNLLVAAKSENSLDSERTTPVMEPQNNNNNNNNNNKSSWPELVGQPSTSAMEVIQKENPTIAHVDIIPDGSMVTMDYRTDRVRVFVAPDNTIAQAPHMG